MDVLGIAVLCITSTILCKIMNRYKEEYSLFISVAVCVVILLSVILYISPAIEMVNDLFSSAGIGTENIKILIKGLGICYITQLAQDICKDNNYESIATQVELVGKISLILLSLPLFKNLIGIVNSLINL